MRTNRKGRDFFLFQKLARHSEQPMSSLINELINADVYSSDSSDGQLCQLFPILVPT